MRAFDDRPERIPDERALSPSISSHSSTNPFIQETVVLTPHNPISACTFFWMFRLIWKCLSNGPNTIDVKIDDRARAEPSSLALSTSWQRHPRLFRAIAHAVGRHYMLLGLWKLAWAVCTWAAAWYLLQEIMKKPSATLAFEILVAATLSAVAIQQVYHGTYVVGLRLRAAMIDMVYHKAMVLSPANVNLGHIMTLVANEVEAISSAATEFHFLWSGCLEIIAVLIIIYFMAGWESALAPILVVVVIIVPIQIYLATVVSRASSTFFRAASERLHFMTEIMTAIKLVKFYAWEDPVRDRVKKVRTCEAAAASTQVMARAVNFALVFAGPVVATLACLLVLQLLDAKMDPILAFTLVSLFNTLRYPLLMMPAAIKSLSSARNAFAVLDEFLNRPEMIDERDTYNCGDREVVFRKTSLRWEKSPADTLSDISLTVDAGEVLAIIGDVGSGKSSLIAAMLGQMSITQGFISVRGLMSYCPQEAWLINSTLKDNILFGTDYEQDRYDAVIKACSLERDLSLFPEGDELPISERGANLSGGQRQRISMARAVYSYSDIVLLDDPLSALDQSVGRCIFDNAIKGFLRDRAVVLVTHQLQYLPECSRVVIMSGGKASEYGTFNDLMARPDSRLCNLMAQFSDTEQNKVPETIDEEVFHIIGNSTSEDTTQASGESDNAIELKQIMLASPNIDSQQQRRPSEPVNYSEKLTGQAHTVNEAVLSQKAEFEHMTLFGPRHMRLNANGRADRDFSRTVAHNMMVPLTTLSKPYIFERTAEVQGGDPNAKWMSAKHAWLRYLRQSDGLYSSVALLVFFWLVHFLRLASDIWIKVWQGNPGTGSKAYSNGPRSDAIVFASLVLAFVVGVAIRGVWLAYTTSRNARLLHDSMLDSLIRAPMSFFDKTPLGRILQSSSQHQADADDRLPDALMQFMQYLPLAVGCLGIMCWQSSMPVFMIGVIIILLGLGAILIWFTRKSGAVDYYKDQQAISKTIMLSHVTASLEGLFSIRAFRCQERFRAILLHDLDRVAAFDLSTRSTRFLVALYIDVLCSLAIFFCALTFVITPTNPSTIGLALSNALQLLVFVQWTLRMWEEASAAMASVGSLQFLSEKVPSEAPPIIDLSRPDTDWPPEGRITFQDVVLRYSTFGVAVLKRISFTIHPKEKIGIVGRTGSGKSTLLVALLRIVEAVSGRIIIDGLDISKIGLQDLRRNVAIIPQESVLFSGTIRENLDPMNTYSDDMIWHALDAVNLATNIRRLPAGMKSHVASAGPRFSLGQRQLFCIARAILMKSQVIVLDEATAAIDAHTDALVQQAITNNFSDCTVLTIAHRLNTIIQSDRIMMMNAGKVIEFDKPLNLLDAKGHFFELVENTGSDTARKLRQLAQEKFIRDKKMVAEQSDVDFFSKFVRPQAVNAVD